MGRIKYEYFSDVIDGVLQKKAQEQIDRDLKLFEGKRVHVTLQLKYKKRSNPQNRYYWGVVVEALRACIHDAWDESIGKEEAHELLKANCNFKEFVNNDSVILKVPMSTANLKTIEFEEYLDRCRKFVYNWFNSNIPLPNEQSEMFEE